MIIDAVGEYKHLEYYHQKPYDEKFYNNDKEAECCANLIASGLIYEHYGMDVAHAIYPTLKDEKENSDWVCNKMHGSFMEAIDAIDAGVEIAPVCKCKD